MLIAIFIVALVILVAIIFGATKSGKCQCFFKKYPYIPKILTLGYITFTGCFVFPIRSDPFPLDLHGLYLLIVCYGVIALALAGTLGLGSEWTVYIVTFVFTAVGMICRYLLEFGEVSNTYNFTMFNIISYLTIIPIGTTSAYHWIARRLRRK